MVVLVPLLRLELHKVRMVQLEGLIVHDHLVLYLKDTESIQGKREELSLSLGFSLKQPPHLEINVLVQHHLPEVSVLSLNLLPRTQEVKAILELSSRISKAVLGARALELVVLHHQEVLVLNQRLLEELSLSLHHLEDIVQEANQLLNYQLDN